MLGVFFWMERLEWPPLRFGHIQRKIIYKFGIPERLRTLRYSIFTGEVVTGNSSFTGQVRCLLLRFFVKMQARKVRRLSGLALYQNTIPLIIARAQRRLFKSYAVCAYQTR